MSHLLYLLRHAKSDWKKEAANDFERPLSKRGISNAPRIATKLAKQANRPETIISAPALRALQPIPAIKIWLEFCCVLILFS
ncbi:MAG: histidine phosphatase family protein [Burkholderiales bacterium]|nr:histidine phosphatase family protein [Nitrosomonas sp.]MCP5273715.1 histidine phosphatase family protein [Burkholderiales bacterium]